MTKDSIDSRYHPGFQRGGDRVRPGVLPSDPAATQYPAPEATDNTDDSYTPAPPSGMVLRGNPFLYALIGVGVILLGLGLWGQWNAADGRTGSYRSPDELVLDEFLAGIAPWCMTLGIGTLVAVLVLCALHWRTRT